MFKRLVAASLRARRARNALALLVVTLGIAVAVALATLALEVGDDLARTLRAAGPNLVMVPAGATLALDLGGATVRPARLGPSLPADCVPALKRSFWKNNLLEAAPELAVAARVGGRPATLAGTWFEHDVVTADGRWHTGLVRLRPRWSVQGRWPREDADEIALGAALAAALGVAPGATVDVDAEGGAATRWRVSGVVAAGGHEDRMAGAPLERVRALSGRPGAIDRVWLSALLHAAPDRPAPDPARDPTGYERYACTAYPEVVARDLASAVGGTEVIPASDLVAGESHVVGRLNLLLLLLALAALAASVLGLFSTATATVVERGVELALLRSLGAGPRAVAALLLAETALVGLAGGALGWALGSLAATALRGGGPGLAPGPAPLLLPIALALALGIALLGTLGPLRLALRLDPAQVLRG